MSNSLFIAVSLMASIYSEIDQHGFKSSPGTTRFNNSPSLLPCSTTTAPTSPGGASAIESFPQASGEDLEMTQRLGQSGSGELETAM